VKLVELLSPRRVVVPLAAQTLDEALRVLVQACVADGRVSDPSRLDEAIRESWPEDTLSIGPHAWLPHFRTDAVPALVVALGIAPAPLATSSNDLPALRMMLLIVAPPRQAAAYLQTVAAFARALSRPEIAEDLLAARSADQVLGSAALREIELEGQLLVRDIMTARVISIRPDATLEDAARLLVRHQVEALPVVGDAGEVLGLLSHRELLRHLVPSYIQRVTTGEFPPHRLGAPATTHPRLTPVREAMARNVLCVSEDQSVADVAHLLAAKDVGRVPVVKDGVLQGFLTRRDIVRKLLGSE
jgi:CBS domain-containing protein